MFKCKDKCPHLFTTVSFIIIIIIIIYLFLTAIGLTPGGSNTVHIYTKTVTEYRERDINNNKKELKIAGRAPSLRVIPWHLPYNWGKSTENPQSIPLTNKFYKELLPFETSIKHFLAEKSSVYCSKQQYPLKLTLFDKSVVKTFLQFQFLCNKRNYT
jgi:hypothetical protein